MEDQPSLSSRSFPGHYDARGASDCAPWGRTQVAAPAERTLSAEQVAAIRAVMRLFVEDDLANGVAPNKRMLCDACQTAQPSLGFIEYDRHLLCNGCATEYEVARARGLALSAGQYVRDKNFGEAEAYALGRLEVE